MRYLVITLSILLVLGSFACSKDKPDSASNYLSYESSGNGRPASHEDGEDAAREDSESVRVGGTFSGEDSSRPTFVEVFDLDEIPIETERLEELGHVSLDLPDEADLAMLELSGVEDDIISAMGSVYGEDYSALGSTHASVTTGMGTDGETTEITVELEAHFGIPGHNDLLPADWPDNVPIMGGFTIRYTSRDSSGMQIVTLGDMPVNDALEFYRSLGQWTIDNEIITEHGEEDLDQLPDYVNLELSRESEHLKINIYEDDEGTYLILYLTTD